VLPSSSSRVTVDWGLYPVIAGRLSSGLNFLYVGLALIATAQWRDSPELL